MKQRTHAWLAVGAIALLEESGEADNLVKLIAPHAKTAAIGAWLPDLNDAKAGFGSLDNHVLKMEVYAGALPERFTMSREVLIDHLGADRKVTELIGDENALNNDWWSTPYRADPPPGKHLANRAMAFATMIVDLMILGDSKVDQFVPGKIGFVEDMDKQALTRKEQLATYFFMLSHFIADACMPCHCDARKLSAYDHGVHKVLESRWNTKITTYFEKDKILASTAKASVVINKAREIWKSLDITFAEGVPDLHEGHDTWLDTIYVCRASHALANIIVPYRDFPHNTDELPALLDLYPGNTGDDRLKGFDRAILHDAILNIAMTWKHIWGKL